MPPEPLSVWHPFTQEALDPRPVHIERGEGVYLYTRDGLKLIDAISSWWVNLHGHSHPLIAEAIAQQARKLEHVIFAGFTHEPAEELASRLRRVLPRPLEHIFFSDDGSTAVEVALKMALQYWRNHRQTRQIASSSRWSTPTTATPPEPCPSAQTLPSLRLLKSCDSRCCAPLPRIVFAAP